jgi:hypothetical protein
MKKLIFDFRHFAKVLKKRRTKQNLGFVSFLLMAMRLDIRKIRHFNQPVIQQLKGNKFKPNLT